MFLIDTSIWIETFKKKSPIILSEIIDFDEATTCLPIVQEVLQGFKDEQAFRTAREAMHALPVVESPMKAAVYDHATQLYRNARRQGLTVRSSVDCLIASCAIKNCLTVLHRDRDYTDLAKISELQEKSI